MFKELKALPLVEKMSVIFIAVVTGLMFVWILQEVFNVFKSIFKGTKAKKAAKAAAKAQADAKATDADNAAVETDKEVKAA